MFLLNKDYIWQLFLDGEVTTVPSTVSSTTLDTSLDDLQEIGPLMGHHHGVKGVVYIVDSKTIKIVGFAYDGK